MVLDYGNGIRGGITRAIYHYDEADNKYLHDYDETKENTYIQYIDFNNQYGYALSQPLPCGRCDNVEDVSIFMYDFINHCNKNSDFGYALMVDLDYPEYLQPCNGITLTHFMPLTPFYTPWKHQKTRCFEGG